MSRVATSCASSPPSAADCWSSPPLRRSRHRSRDARGRVDAHLQTTPRMAPQLARAAATARDLLVAEAARHWSTDPAGLVARNGRVERNDGTSKPYGDLAARLTGTVATPRMSAPDAWVQRGKPAR